MQDSTQQPKSPTTWEEAVRPLLMSCKFSEKFGTNMVIGPQGSAALHKAIMTMVKELERLEKRTLRKRIWSFLMGDW